MHIDIVAIASIMEPIPAGACESEARSSRFERSRARHIHMYTVHVHICLGIVYIIYV